MNISDVDLCLPCKDQVVGLCVLCVCIDGKNFCSFVLECNDLCHTEVDYIHR